MPDPYVAFGRSRYQRSGCFVAAPVTIETLTPPSDAPDALLRMPRLQWRTSISLGSTRLPKRPAAPKVMARLHALPARSLSSATADPNSNMTAQIAGAKIHVKRLISAKYPAKIMSEAGQPEGLSPCEGDAKSRQTINGCMDWPLIEKHESPYP